MFLQIGERIINADHVVTIEFGMSAKLQLVNGETISLNRDEAIRFRRAFTPTGGVNEGPTVPVRNLNP